MPNWERRPLPTAASAVAVYVGEKLCHVNLEGVAVRARAPCEAVVENFRTLVGWAPPLDETRIEVDDPVFRHTGPLIASAFQLAVVLGC